MVGSCLFLEEDVVVGEVIHLRGLLLRPLLLAVAALPLPSLPSMTAAAVFLPWRLLTRGRSPPPSWRPPSICIHLR